MTPPDLAMARRKERIEKAVNKVLYKDEWFYESRFSTKETIVNLILNESAYQRAAVRRMIVKQYVKYPLLPSQAHVIGYRMACDDLLVALGKRK